ncbi:hypothetical protein [Nocardioides convexus]|uniref:hypothetical protein n=1 Tax=Nocardioides convexus TaxID=2712224 RepID=UPI0024184BB3|nr:hypothetical protein [Nocardioides convexus]
MRSRSVPLLLVGLAIAALALVPLGYVLWSTADLGPGEARDFLWRPRIGEPAVEHHPAARRRHADERRGRCRRRVGGRADRRTGAGMVARAAVRAARRSGLRQRLRLGLDDPRRAVPSPAR